MAEGKKSKKKTQKTQSLHDFLGGPTGGSWADDDGDDFIAAEKEKPEPGARAAGSWRQDGGGGGDRPFQSSKALPDSPPFSLRVANLPFEISEQSLAEFFGVQESAVRIMKDRNTNQAKGFGYVDFPSREALADGLKKNLENFNGRTIRLEIADAGRGGGRGGAGGRGNFKFSGGGFDAAGGGRDWMGTGTPEQAPDRGGRGGRGFEGRGRGFGGFDRDAPFSRDAFGEGGARDDRRPPRETRPIPTFTRDAMGSENAPSGYEPNPNREEFAGRGRGRGGFMQRDRAGISGDTWADGREAMGTGVVEERPARPARSDAESPSFSRDVMQSDTQDGPSERRGFGRGGGRGERYSATNVPSREGFGADKAPEYVAPPPRETYKAPSSNWRSRGQAAESEEPQEEEEQPTHEEDQPEEPPARPPKKAAAPPSPLAAPAPAPKGKRAPRQVPITPEELFAQQQQREQRRRQQEEMKSKQAQQVNANPWEALNLTKKKKKKKKGASANCNEDDDGEAEGDGAAE